MADTIQIGEIAISVARKDIKHVYLSVHPPSGRVTLVAPKGTRPEVARAYAVSKLAQFMSAFDESHWKAAKGVLRYLKGTMDMGITYSPSDDMYLVGYTDADYAGDKLDRKSTSGLVFLLNNALVSWSSQKQPSVALSSTESEYVACASGGTEAVWLRNLLEELNFPQNEPTPIFVDNTSAISLTGNPVLHSRTKHIDVRHHKIRELVQNGEVVVLYVHTSKQLADGLTKPLLKGKLEENRSAIGLAPKVADKPIKKQAKNVVNGGRERNCREQPSDPPSWRTRNRDVQNTHRQIARRRG